MIALKSLVENAPIRINLPFLQKLFDRQILASNPFQLQLASNCCYQAADFMNLLSFASLNNYFLQSACDFLRSYIKTPSIETVCFQLKKPSVSQVDSFINQYLSVMLQKLPRFSTYGKKRPATVAIDFHDHPYYGDEDDDMVVGGPRKASTNRFHRYATIFLCERKREFTLGVHSVKKHARTLAVVKYLISQARDLVALDCLLGDGGLYVVEVAKYLQQQGIDFIIRGTKKKRVKQLINEVKAELVNEGDVHCREYTMRSKQTNQQARVRLLIYREQGDIKVLVTALDSQRSASEAITLFKSRFGIETSYRMKHQTKAKTRSKFPELRSILFGMSVLLYNLWKSYAAVMCKGWQHYRQGKVSQKRPMETRMAILQVYLLIFLLLRSFPEVKPG